MRETGNKAESHYRSRNILILANSHRCNLHLLSVVTILTPKKSHLTSRNLELSTSGVRTHGPPFAWCFALPKAVLTHIVMQSSQPFCELVFLSPPYMGITHSTWLLLVSTQPFPGGFILHPEECAWILQNAPK